MLGVILFTLFSIATLGTVVVLADSILRGREAFVRLRREMAEPEPVGRVRVVIESSAEREPLPAGRLRLVSRTSGGRRRMPVQSRTLLPAAA